LACYGAADDIQELTNGPRWLTRRQRLQAWLVFYLDKPSIPRRPFRCSFGRSFKGHFTEHGTVLTTYKTKPTTSPLGQQAGNSISTKNDSAILYRRFGHRVPTGNGYRCSLPFNYTLGHLPRTKGTTKPLYNHQPLGSAHEAHEPVVRADAVATNDLAIEKHNPLDAILGAP
jgi:hypothetical protein